MDGLASISGVDDRRIPNLGIHALSAACPEVPVTTNLSVRLIHHWYGYRCGDVYAHSTMMDKVGIDVYPATWSYRC